MRARLQAHWRLKLLLTLVLNVAFWSGYELLGRRAFFPLRTPPLWWPDVAIPYQPGFWSWIYLSQFLFTGTLPWLIDSRDGIRRYVIGFAIMSLASFALFAVFPVASPRAAVEAGGGAMTIIRAYDGALNAFPSLHAAFLVYMARLAWRMFGRTLPPITWTAGAIWGGAILYATIATRQHYAIDLAAGAALGAVADWLAWAPASDSAVAKIERSSGAASHEGSR